MPKTFYQIETDQVLDHVESSDEGLSSDKAQRRLDEYGSNSIRADHDADEGLPVGMTVAAKTEA